MSTAAQQPAQEAPAATGSGLWGPFAGAALGGLLVGLAGWPAVPWPFAWLGVAASAWATAVELRRARVVAGLVAGSVLHWSLWLAWSPAMAATMAPSGLSAQLLIGLGFVVVAALPVVVLLCAGALLFGQTRGWFRLWLPFVWVIGSPIQGGWTGIRTDWLFTQVDVGPIMQALAAYGLDLTTGLCLFIAASAGEALAQRSWRTLVPAAFGLGVLGLAPPPQVAGLDTLERVGVVHMPSPTDVPPVDLVDGDLDIVIWPEHSFAEQPAVHEGPANARLDAAPGGPDTWHLVGVRTPPRYGSQNMAVVVDPAGAITQARAKTVLMPVFERSFLGRGRDVFVPGHRLPLVDLGGLATVPLICGEVLHRHLVARGVRAGAELLVVMARDRYQGGTALADAQVLAHLRLRAIEFGVPAVYASIGGRASMVSPRGEVLARSEVGATSGVLTWSREAGPRDRTPVIEPSVAVLYSAASPDLRLDCKPGRCVFHAVEDLVCPQAPTPTVVVSAHGDAEQIAGLDPEALASLVACFQPELVVLDACYGANAPFLRAMGEATDAEVVAVPAYLAARGFRYEPDFYSAAAPATRAAAVHTEPPSPMFAGRPDVPAIVAAQAMVEAADGDTLRPLVRSWVPTLVAVEVAPDQEVLFPADWRKIGRPPDPR